MEKARIFQSDSHFSAQLGWKCTQEADKPNGDSRSGLLGQHAGQNARCIVYHRHDAGIIEPRWTNHP